MPNKSWATSRRFRPPVKICQNTKDSPLAGIGAEGYHQGMKNTMMTAHVHSYGGPENIKIEQTGFPALEPNKMLIEVRAADVNPMDIKLEEGMFAGSQPMQFPFTPGADVAGVVREVGSKVSRFHPGDEVFGFIDKQQGGYSEFVVSSPDLFALKPSSVSMVEAASIPLVAMTAWQALFEHGLLHKGQKVLIHGAAGGVGGMAVQLAKWKKAEVFATCARDNLSYVRRLGADTVINYESEFFEEIAKNVDLVIDVIGGDTQRRSIQCLQPMTGRLISTVGIGFADQAEKRKVKAISMKMHPSLRILEEVSDLFERGVLRTHVSQTFPLQQARFAQEALKNNHAPGKIVLNVMEALH